MSKEEIAHKVWDDLTQGKLHPGKEHYELTKNRCGLIADMIQKEKRELLEYIKHHAESVDLASSVVIICDDLLSWQRQGEETFDEEVAREKMQAEWRGK